MERDGKRWKEMESIRKVRKEKKVRWNKDKSITEKNIKEKDLTVIGVERRENVKKDEVTWIGERSKRDGE